MKERIEERGCRPMSAHSGQGYELSLYDGD
jgi:hypothetical protein